MRSIILAGALVLAGCAPGVPASIGQFGQLRIDLYNTVAFCSAHERDAVAREPGRPAVRGCWKEDNGRVHIRWFDGQRDEISRSSFIVVRQ